MSNIDKQALRLTAEKAKDNFMPNFMVPTLDVLALLDELEAKDKRNAELEDLLEAEIKSWMQRCDSANNRREAAEKRIAELEAREVTLPAQKFCPDEYVGSVLWAESEIWNQAISECAKAIRAAGIGKGE
ncbi:ead/Ea22-like family protein [Citrobacter sedlakii]|uniref:hypothetical protein n=1 Tax=Citrobacter sedlakii TaxID=67826 RepID=UPI0019805F58|nr:hypothetical protein [Citrobacter sedlakii]MBN6599905.1 hypothetical protein [Citrobacter sedlakii]